MNLWLHVRRARLTVLTSLVVGIALIPSGSVYLPVPNLLGGPRLAVPLALLIPLAVAIAVTFGLTTGDPAIEATANRPLGLFDAIYVLAIAALTLATCTLAWAIGGTAIALSAGRSALGYIGLALIARRTISPHAAAVLPAGFAVAVSLFGSQSNRQQRWWAWPLASVDNPIAWGVAVALLGFGVVVVLLFRPQR
jgi:hypothetical protein